MRSALLHAWVLAVVVVLFGALSVAVAQDSAAKKPKPAPRRVEYRTNTALGFDLNAWNTPSSSFRVTYGMGNVLQVKIDNEILPAEKARSRGLRIELTPFYVDGQGNKTGEKTELVVIAYTLTNEGLNDLKTEVRLSVDTMIEQSDRHPFLVPGPLGRITTSADLRSPVTLPPYFKAISTSKDPKEIHFVLQGLKVEGPDRCQLTDLRSRNDPNWSSAALDMYDSSFLLYWPARSISRGEQRILGFGCGFRPGATIKP